MVGAGSRQRGYQKAGRVKRQAANGRKNRKNSPGNKQGNTLGVNARKCLTECSCVISANEWLVTAVWLVQWWMGNAVCGWCAAVVWYKRQCGEWAWAHEPDSWHNHVIFTSWEALMTNDSWNVISSALQSKFTKSENPYGPGYVIQM